MLISIALPLQNLPSLPFGTWYIPCTIYPSNHFLMTIFPWLFSYPLEWEYWVFLRCSHHHPSSLPMASQEAHPSGFRYSLTWMPPPLTSLVWTIHSGSVLSLRSVYGCMREDVVLPLPSEFLAETLVTKRLTEEQLTGISCLIVLHLTALHRCCVCYTSKVWGSPASSPSVSTTFPTAFAPVTSLCQFGNSHNISNFIVIAVFVMVICDQGSLGTLQTKPIWDHKLNG